jgi:hypothetical protein
MGLREISRADFVRISEQRDLKRPAGATEAGWLACDDDDLVAVLFYHAAKAEWQALIYQCGEVTTPSVAAVLSGFKTRDDAAFAVRSKMQCIILTADIAQREHAAAPKQVETA